MAVINVYEQYFAAEAEFSGVKRNGVLVMLTSDSEAGSITYTAALTFFPHVSEEDFAVSYDAYFEKVLYQGKGRRSKKKEEAYLKDLPSVLNEMAAEHNARIDWDKPLREERRG